MEIQNYLAYICCPLCRASLQIKSSSCYCRRCNKSYPIVDGIPRLVTPDESMWPWDDYYKTYFYKDPNPLTPCQYYADFIPRTSSCLLDAGSGDGVMSAPLAGKIQQIWCVDLSLFRLKLLLKRNLGNMIPLLASVTKLPFNNQFFDTIINIFVIEHLSKNNAIIMLKELNRTLKCDGTLIIATDTRFYYHYLRSVIQTVRHMEITKDNPTHINLMYPYQLRTLLHECGFRIVYEDLWKIGHRFKLGKTFHNYFPFPLRWKENVFTRGFMFVCRKRKYTARPK